MTIQNKGSFTRIKPSGSYSFLTQSSDDIDIRDRVYVKVVNLGINDSVDNWKEITEIDAAEIEYDKRYYDKDHPESGETVEEEEFNGNF